MRQLTFPNITISEKPSGTRLSTLVRKQHDGTWFLIEVTNYYPVAGDDVAEGINIMQEFLKLAYAAMLFADIYPDSQMVDPDQRPEDERMKDLYPLI